MLGVHVCIGVGDALHGMRGSKHGSINWPSFANSLQRRLITNDIQFLAPVLNALSFAVDSAEQAITSIINLFFRSGPSAVAGFIITIVVATINGVITGWFKSHIIEEVNKGFEPPVTNRDTSAAPFGIGGVFQITAPRNQALPCVIFRGPALAMRNHSLHIETAAGSNAKFLKVVASAVGHLPAVALANPKCFSPVDGTAPNNNQTSVAVATNINHCAFPHNYFLGVVNG